MSLGAHHLLPFFGHVAMAYQSGVVGRSLIISQELHPARRLNLLRASLRTPHPTLAPNSVPFILDPRAE
ncbi:hypothetical protein [Micromonospora sp. CB01531]|uniref:hypothetical protein n=1 Tax=Micromonospora sp. CB01531 TaxID=1718947 RepID=UPI003FD31080